MLLLCSALDTPEVTHPSPPTHSSPQVKDMSQYDPSIVAEMAELSDEYALRLAAWLRDYRESYGLKNTMAYLFQAEATASFRLLRRLHRMDSPAFVDEVRSLRKDVEAAFEESFRCLLGTSTQTMLARGVARMVTQTAQDLKVTLPANIIAVLPSLERWQAEDLDKISSTYPNYAIISDIQFKAEGQIEFLLKKLEDVKVEALSN